MLDIRYESANLFSVRWIHQSRLSELPFSFCRLLGEYMARKSLVPGKLSRACDFKPLGSTAVRLYLGHFI